jgi:hypothetical protein
MDTLTYHIFIPQDWRYISHLSEKSPHIFPCVGSRWRIKKKYIYIYCTVKITFGPFPPDSPTKINKSCILTVNLSRHQDLLRDCFFIAGVWLFDIEPVPDSFSFLSLSALSPPPSPEGPADVGGGLQTLQCGGV